jgi:hypothetical protein
VVEVVEAKIVVEEEVQVLQVLVELVVQLVVQVL